MNNLARNVQEHQIKAKLVISELFFYLKVMPSNRLPKVPNSVGFYV